MKRAFFSNSYTPGYGPRIFVPYEFVPEVQKRLDQLSRWGGADKDTGLTESWEFGTHAESSSYLEAIALLKGLGFTVEGVGAHNHNQVWS